MKRLRIGLPSLDQLTVDSQVQFACWSVVPW